MEPRIVGSLTTLCRNRTQAEPQHTVRLSPFASYAFQLPKICPATATPAGTGTNRKGVVA